MKKILFVLIIFSLYFPLFSQNTRGSMDDEQRIALSVYIPDDAPIPASAKRTLQNKLNQVVSKNGLGGTKNQRFILTSNISILYKEITPTAPPMHAYTLMISFYVGDGIDGNLYSSTSIEAKGVGSSEVKAYQAALKSVRPNDPELQTMIEIAKQKIIEYYNSQCDFILKEAESLAAKDDFEKAMCKLIEVPNICKDCYSKCMDKLVDVFQQKIDKEGTLILQEANNIWNASQDSIAGEKVGEIILKIHPKSSAYPKAMDLSAKVEARIKEIHAQEWAFKQQQQANDHQEKMTAIANAHTEKMSTILSDSIKQANVHEENMAAIDASISRQQLDHEENMAYISYGNEIIKQEVKAQEELLDIAKDVASVALGNMSAIYDIADWFY